MFYISLIGRKYWGVWVLEVVVYKELCIGVRYIDECYFKKSRCIFLDSKYNFMIMLFLY